MNLNLLPVKSPFDSTWLCWCGQMFPTEAAAGKCEHPPNRKSLPGPRHEIVPAGYPPSERRRAAIGGIIALTMWVMIVVAMAVGAIGTEPPGPAPADTPAVTARP